MPAPLGTLTMSGLLYEDNYEAWLTWMEVFVECILGQGPANALRAGRQSNFVTYRAKLPESRTVATILRNHVHPVFLARIPERHIHYCQPLLCRLKAHAKPSRFVDLPPELRAVVYELVLPKVQIMGPTSQRQQQLPPILSVSRLTRSDALPIFYRCVTHSMVLTTLSRSCDGDKVVELARKWVEDALRSNAKVLRTFELEFHVRISPRSRKTYCHVLKLTFSPTMGLQLVCPTTLNVASQALLQKHITETEVIRKAMGLQGEAIILALISKPELWEVVMV